MYLGVDVCVRQMCMCVRICVCIKCIFMSVGMEFTISMCWMQICICVFVHISVYRHKH